MKDLRRGPLALAGIVLSVPTLLASAPGDWFDEDIEGVVDRTVQPLDLPTAVHAAIVLVAGAVLLVSLAVLLSSAERESVRRADIRIAVPLLLAGTYVAFAYRVTTAAVAGANIGAGMLLMLGVAVVPALLAHAGYNVRRSRRTPPSP